VAPVISGSGGRTGVPAFATAVFATAVFATAVFATTGRAGGRVPMSARPPGA
jgi:hypothetical protein